MFSKAQVLKHFSNSVTETARFFDCSPAAVSQWGETIPNDRSEELMRRLPAIFPPPPGVRLRRTAIAKG
jgi:hypothetical protein